MDSPGVEAEECGSWKADKQTSPAGVIQASVHSFSWTSKSRFLGSIAHDSRGNLRGVRAGTRSLTTPSKSQSVGLHA